MSDCSGCSFAGASTAVENAFVGVCGHTLCCSSWMKGFQPISIKLAKRQGLSLNPSKISGQCGRLLCCLAHENDHYPKKGKQQRDRQQAAGPPA